MEISVKVSPAPEGVNTVTVVITGNSHGGFAETHSKLRFLGASCHSSVLSGTGADQPIGRGISSFTIQVEKEKSAVIALVTDVCASVGKRVTHRTEACLIPLCWNNGVLEVKHHTPFVSKTDCLGQIIGDDLTVVVGAKRFSTCNTTMFGDDSTRQKMQKLRTNGYAIVLDGNLLCRFLVGEATLDEVEKAVVAEPVDVAKLQEQNALLSLQVETLKVEKESVIKRVNQLNEMYQRAQGSLEALQSEHRKLQEAHDQVCGESRRDQVMLTSQAKELNALKRARVKDMQTILGLTVNDGVLCAKVRFGGWSWVALKRVKAFAATALRGFELEASDRPDHNMG